MTKSKIFFYFCLSFIFGIFIESILKISWPIWLGFFILGLILISSLARYKKAIVIGFCLVFLGVGIWWQTATEAKIKNSELKKYISKEIILKGRVSAEPDVRENSAKLVIKAKSADVKPVSEKILITIAKYPEYKYGDELRIAGKLEAPFESEDFSYKNYLMKDGIYFVMYFPKVELLGKEKQQNYFSLAYSKVIWLKEKLRQSINQNISPPQNAILNGMILGDRGQIPADLKEELNNTGVSHIIAISGGHVVLLLAILMPLLLGFGLWRGQAFYFVIIIISLYILMTGLQASAVRSGIMAGLFLWGQKLGRKAIGYRSLVSACALMLAINPLLLFYDIGFQLSFLAVLGLIYLAPLIGDWLKFIPKDKFFNLKEILAYTFAAQIFTLPILIYNFGRISLIAPLTNILLLPVVPLIMIFGFALGFLGSLWNVLGWILMFPVWILLSYFIFVVEIFSALPLAFIKIENIHWLWLAFFYLVLWLAVWRLNQKKKLKFLDF